MREASGEPRERRKERSGRQNIAEGSRAAGTSSQTELRLTNIARANLDELLLDYEDFLRQRGQRLWSRHDPEARAVRAVGAPENRPNSSDPSDPSDAPKRPSQRQPAPPCPLCGKPMARRTARRGARAGSQFWGCSAYPECRGTRREQPSPS